MKISAGHITNGVLFQFKKDGPICRAHNRFIHNGFKLVYFRGNQSGLKSAKYKSSENARNRMLILREDLPDSAKQKNRNQIRA